MKNKFIITLICLLGSLSVFAENTASAANPEMSTPLLIIIYTVVGLLFLVTCLLYLVSKELKRYTLGDNVSEEVKMYDNRSTWEKIFQIKPVGTDKDTRINEPHDGIYELDNPPPPWFMFLFYGCILFAVVYFIRFSVSDYGYTQEDEYIAEMKLAEEENAVLLASEENNIDESNVIPTLDEATIASGKSIFMKNCSVCHGSNAGGIDKNGPNLTDQYWKHGGGANNIFKTVKYGVIEKGMLPWKDQLSPKKMQEVISYILSLEGSNPEGGLPPEGDKWVTPEQASDTAATEE